MQTLSMRLIFFVSHNVIFHPSSELRSSWEDLHHFCKQLLRGPREVVSRGSIFFWFFFGGVWSQGFPYYITHWTWGFSTPDLLRLPFFSRKFPFRASFRKLQTKPIWVEPFAQNVQKTIQKPIKNTFLPQDSGIIFLHPALICSLNIEIRLDFEANQPLQQVIPNLQVARALSGETRVAEGEILVWAQLARSWLAGWAHARISPPSPSPSSLQPVQRLRMIFHKPEWTVYSCEKVCEVNQPSYLLGHQWPPPDLEQRGQVATNEAWDFYNNEREQEGCFSLTARKCPCLKKPSTAESSL